MITFIRQKKVTYIFLLLFAPFIMSDEFPYNSFNGKSEPTNHFSSNTPFLSNNQSKKTVNNNAPIEMNEVDTTRALMMLALTLGSFTDTQKVEALRQLNTPEKIIPSLIENINNLYPTLSLIKTGELESDICYVQAQQMLPSHTMKALDNQITILEQKSNIAVAYKELEDAKKNISASPTKEHQVDFIKKNIAFELIVMNLNAQKRALIMTCLIEQVHTS